MDETRYVGLVRRRFFFAGVGLLAIATALFAVPGKAEEVGQPRAYLRGIEDLPLMAELHELEESGIVFDKPGGRIVISMAQGRVTPGDVLAFYARTLPQLGWRMEKATRFTREGEALDIEFEAGSSPVIVRFSLSPHSLSPY
ncbi:MAG: hypothetical protein COA65_09115 [Rhodospirillaceae bacterium]|nr:MAG: hypothetical protein COA65_09115 [Rhodospirillaceae bacterium]